MYYATLCPAVIEHQRPEFELALEPARLRFWLEEVDEQRHASFMHLDGQPRPGDAHGDRHAARRQLFERPRYTTTACLVTHDQAHARRQVEERSPRDQKHGRALPTPNDETSALIPSNR